MSAVLIEMRRQRRLGVSLIYLMVGCWVRWGSIWVPDSPQLNPRIGSYHPHQYLCQSLLQSRGTSLEISHFLVQEAGKRNRSSGNLFACEEALAPKSQGLILIPFGSPLFEVYMPKRLTSTSIYKLFSDLSIFWAADTEASSLGWSTDKAEARLEATRGRPHYSDPPIILTFLPNYHIDKKQNPRPMVAQHLLAWYPSTLRFTSTWSLHRKARNLGHVWVLSEKMANKRNDWDQSDWYMGDGISDELSAGLDSEPTDSLEVFASNNERLPLGNVLSKSSRLNIPLSPKSQNKMMRSVVEIFELEEDSPHEDVEMGEDDEKRRNEKESEREEDLYPIGRMQ